MQQQLLHGLYRDVLNLDKEYVKSDGFKSLLAQNQGFLTKRFLDEQFDRCFADRTNTVEFAFDPDFAKFKRAYRSTRDTDRPMLLFMVGERLFAEVMGRQLPQLI